MYMLLIEMAVSAVCLVMDRFRVFGVFSASLTI